ncbi:MAG: class D beta-lactamase [Bacteroidota bacterium]
MKTFLPVCLSGLMLLCAFTCRRIPPSVSSYRDVGEPILQEVVQLQPYLDSLGFQGATVVFDPATNTYSGCNLERWSKGYLPASTFKIPNSLIALETGVVSGPDMVFPWDGKKRQLKIWEKDMTFREAFHISCVPCYQQIAREIGVSRMKEFTQKFEYGELDIREDNIDLFWLTGDSKISQFQQLDFLQKLYQERLPLSPATMETFKEMMVRDKTDTYTLRGKTGWAIRDGENIGWFVGYLEVGENVYFFATNIEPAESGEMIGFPEARVQLTMKLFHELHLIPSG